MKTAVRVPVALILALIVEFGFLETVKRLKEPKKTEIHRIIRISLIKRKEQITVEREAKKEKEVKRAKPKSAPKGRTEVVSKRPKRELPKKSVATKKKERGGLKPLQGNLPEYYVNAVEEAIRKNIFYPLEALEKGEEGTVEVQFTLSRKGKVLECKPVKGKSRILQRAACIAVERAKFPPIPNSVENDRLTFQLEVNYNLQDVNLQ